MAPYEIGEHVRLLFDVKSDGTVQGRKRGEMLLNAGAEGYVKGRGNFLMDEVIYDIHFVKEDIIIGCREKELALFDKPWSPAAFSMGDNVVAAFDLISRGALLAEAGAHGTVTAVLSHPARGYVFEVKFEGADGLCLLTEVQIKRPEQAF
ncbi:MAG: nitrogen fixation protein NifZ [Deltaproteobacteria bacterium]|nr:nitrogen fixation protein NifZ [Deltaproteobacteria bacterium]